jgi:hypothetical protein
MSTLRSSRPDRRKLRYFLAVLFLLLLILVFTRSLATQVSPEKQQAPPSILVSVNPVLIPASVTDAFRKIEVKVNAPAQGKLHLRTSQGYSPQTVKSIPAPQEAAAK